ncbi:hypothetical protein NA57DRAFT_69624 [Rhizodiscina lignyota]|uniref:AT hook domain-containing protein family protein n=1 Tax=Rhizodiscina lignyota TaxID=1504668 RepID=A0A9P4I491_9PEZI|nr:hypothetical protein NA57DRAFT_69624 [Rhizodiscina lignyota]
MSNHLVLSPRRTRSRSKQPRPEEPAEVIDLTQPVDEDRERDRTNGKQADNSTVVLLSPDLTESRTGLKSINHALLLRKQRWLRDSTVSIPEGSRNSHNLGPAIDATLVFAQEEAGTAVCISPDGLLLTCSHCVAESVAEFDGSKNYWLRDLALLQIVAAQSTVDLPASLASNSRSWTFPFFPPAERPPKINAALSCVGHPGSEDLQAVLSGVKTNYDTLCVSSGTFRGYAKGQDVQDNSEIGALKHTCWTYWGHSGAPLIEQATGKLVGLHSSWDDQTGMRRGVPLEAILEFLREKDGSLDA